MRAQQVANSGEFTARKRPRSRHKSVDTLRGYDRDAELFRDHAGAGPL
jgi:hypothetical protein